MQPKKKKLTGQQGELMRALEITPDDLIANDAGVIPETQQETVLERQSYMWQPFLIVSMVFSAMALVLGPLMFLSNNMQPFEAFAFGGAFLSSGIIFQVIRFWQRRMLQSELAQNQLETVQGIAVVNVDENNSILEVNGLKLKASPDVLRRVKHLDPYLIHYLPKSKVILSMEHIPDNENIRHDQASNRLLDATDEPLVSEAKSQAMSEQQ